MREVYASSRMSEWFAVILGRYARVPMSAARPTSTSWTYRSVCRLDGWTRGHLDGKLGAFRGVSNIARRNYIDTKPNDNPMHSGDDGEGTPLRSADGVLEFFEVVVGPERLARSVRSGIAHRI
jgi:hypothetical protein